MIKVNLNLTRVSKKPINSELLSKMLINSELLKVSKNDQFENLCLQSWRSLIQRVPLGTLPQEVLMSFPHNQMTLTSFFIFSYKGYFYQIWATKTTP